MLANFFETSKPINFIAILGLFFVYFFLALFSTFSLADFSSDFLLNKVYSVALFLVLFFLYNFVISKNKLTQENTSYAFLIFIAFLGAFKTCFFDLKMLVVGVFSFLLFRKVYILKNPEKSAEKMFDAGLWTGVIFIIEPFFAVFFGFIFAAIFLFKAIDFKTILIPILGFLAPLLIYCSYCVWFDKIADFKSLFIWVTSVSFTTYAKQELLIPIVVTVGISIFALLAQSPQKLSVSGNERKKWVLYIVQFLTALVFIILYTSKNGSEFLIAFFPMSLLVANWLEHLKSNLIKNVVLYILVCLPFLWLTV